MKISKLPLYWRLKEKGSANIVPDFMPFEYDFDESLQLIIQKRNKEILDHLEEIYKAESNIGYLQDANEIAKPYGVDFMEFIDRALAQWGPDTKNILEVGCGGCTILKQLKDKGYEVIGVDPSPIAKRDGEKKGIRIINEFFPSPLYTDKVDLIFHCDVIEHVSDPVQFLRNQKNQLSENGLIIISLPDCNEGIAKGEISMTMHQHLNYFDSEGLRNTVEAAGLDVLTIEVAKYGGSLYVCARNTPNKQYIKKTGRAKFEKFNTIIEDNIKKVTNEIGAALKDSSKKVGFYVPLRTLPYISILGKYDGFRFFDDTHHWYNRAFDGVEVYIENFGDLKNKPVTDLYIMSLTFGDVIKKKVEGQIKGINTIKTLREIFEN
jgi:2-polyprenyl-3-methyl-5-hydroxy-6-metoxy-1,4-benzoquinol methylase